MSESQKTVVCVLTSLMLCAGAKAIGADSAANPYQGIVDRNVFGLKPPPPPPRPEDNKPPAPKITLNGITTILGNKRALMSVQMPARPPEPAKPQSFFLAEGQRDGDIEVLEINEKLDGGRRCRSNPRRAAESRRLCPAASVQSCHRPYGRWPKDHSDPTAPSAHTGRFGRTGRCESWRGNVARA